MKKNWLAGFKSYGKIASFIIAIPMLYFVVTAVFPYAEMMLKPIAMLSAGLSFVEGGKSAILNEDNHNFEDNIMIGDTETVPYEPLEDEVFAPPVKPVPVPPPVSSEVPPSSAETAADNEVKPANVGVVQRKTYSAGNTSAYIPLKAGYIKNSTSLSAQKIADNVQKRPDFKIATDGTPQVLIMHTHATESYQPVLRDWFSKDYNSRTTDNTKNMTRIGDEIENQLKSAGIGVIHNKTLHDYPSYNGAYERSAVTVKQILKENPTIKVVLDVHRDAIQPNANTMIAPVVEINGRSAAQVMIISGCDNGKMNMPNYMENLKFSAALQSTMEGSYKGLTRPILFDYRKYNQNLTTGSILLEMGGHANTLDEAIYAGELVGRSLVKLLLELK